MFTTGEIFVSEWFRHIYAANYCVLGIPKYRNATTSKHIDTDKQGK